MTRIENIAYAIVSVATAFGIVVASNPTLV